MNISYPGIFCLSENLKFGELVNLELASVEEVLPQRGVIIDIGHGVGAFSFEVARALLEQGFFPDTISSDIHILDLQGPTYDLPTTMSKFFNLGMDIEEIIRATTLTPAKAIRREKEIGSLKQGRRADIAILEIQEGRFKFYDCFGDEMVGKKKISSAFTIKDGRIL